MLLSLDDVLFINNGQIVILLNHLGKVQHLLEEHPTKDYERSDLTEQLVAQQERWPYPVLICRPKLTSNPNVQKSQHQHELNCDGLSLDLSPNLLRTQVCMPHQMQELDRIVQRVGAHENR